MCICSEKSFLNFAVWVRRKQ